MLVALVILAASNLALVSALYLVVRNGSGAQRAHERRVLAWDAKEREYLNRIFHLVDKPWEQAPIDSFSPPDEPAGDPIEWPEAEVYGAP